MNENPEGTPNPLNPAPGTGDEMAAGTGLDFVETEQTSEVISEPEAPKAPEMPEIPETPVVSEIPEIPETPVMPEAELGEIQEAPNKISPASFTESAESIKVETNMAEPEKPIDPVMQPVSHNNFDTLGMNDSKDEVPVEEIKEETFTRMETPVEDIPVSATPISNTPELVAKDSIVEPAGGGNKKKVLIIGAIVLLLVAIICGATAVAIMMVGNSSSGDRVSKAIEKLINGGMPSIVSVQGTINSFSNVDDADISSFNIDFNGTFDTAYNTNSVSAKINTELSSGDKVTIGVDELENKDGDVFFKVRGLDTIKNNPLVSAFSGVIETIDDEWILTSGDFAENMEGLEIFDNSSTCLIGALGTLPKYSKDIAKKYEANQFINYSTDKLEISKKKNPLYRITIDSDKLTAFINSLSNNGFVNELNACVDNVATNENVALNMIEGVFMSFPTIYVEINDDYDFTRVYFKANTGDEASSMTTTADLALSYPSKLEIAEPEEYMNMTTLVNTLVYNVFSSENQ